MSVSVGEHRSLFDPQPSPSGELVVSVLYTNYRGETSLRKVVPQQIWFGESEWHSGKQWFLEVLDVEKGVERSFCLKDVRWIGDS